MKRFFVIIFLCGGFLRAQEAAPSPAPPEDLSARSRALELAGAFTNEGYKIRDGFWSGDIEMGKPRFLEVNLFAGNEYWFCAAATSPARKIAVTLFDAKGRPIETEPYADGAVAGAGAEPEASGKYIVKIELLEGQKAPFCLLYAYK